MNTLDSSEATPPPVDANPFVRMVEEDLANRLDITTDRIHRRRKGDWLAVDGKHRFVTGISGNFFDVFVVIPKRHRKAIHLDT